MPHGFDPARGELIWANEYWSRHLSLANALDSGHTDDLPVLLRGVADMIEAEQIRPMEILDLTVNKKITADGPWW